MTIFISGAYYGTDNDDELYLISLAFSLFVGDENRSNCIWILYITIWA